MLDKKKQCDPLQINLKFKNAIYEYLRTHKVVRTNRLTVFQ